MTQGPFRHPALAWSLLVVLVVLSLEPIAYAVFASRTLVQDLLTTADRSGTRALLERAGVSQERLTKELKALYLDRVRFHPYRWYALPADYRGVYITTDGHGFRIDPLKVDSRTDKIAFFGGSTMFSVRTTNEGSIPALFSKALDERVAQALNFGIGGYSSTTELTTFIEVLRAYDRIKYAVFYDGYNEILSYVQRLQDNATASYYDVMGYHYFDALRPAMESVIDEHETRFSYTPRAIRLIKGVVRRLRGTRNINFIVRDADVTRHAERIVALYAKNVRDIAAVARQHHVVPIFFWHPDIGSTAKKPFTPREARIKATDPVVRRLSAAVRTILAQKPELATHHWFDLSDALDALDGRDHFVDPVHLTDDANRLIAGRIASSLQPIVPRAYWK